jgi:hypothetical protein
MGRVLMQSLALLMAVVLLTACGGASSGPATLPAEAIELAAAKLEQPGSLSFTIKGGFRSKDLGNRRLPFTGKGIMLLGKDGSWIWLDMRRMMQIIIAGEVPREDRYLVMALLDSPRGWRAELRSLGKTTWMRMPALQEIFDSKPWVRLNSDDPNTGLDIALEQAPNNPVDLVPYLRAVGKIETVGREDVNGAQTTHYRSRVVLAKVARNAPAKKRAALRKAIRRVREETGRRTTPIEIWLDDDLTIRRIRFVDTFPPAEDEKYPTTFKATMDLLGFGVTVDIPRPPARKVMSEAEFDALTLR